MANQLTNRDTRILDAAIELAKADGYQWITRAQVCARAEVSAGTVNNAYGDMRGLKRAVLRAAVEQGIIEIVAQGLADNHPIALEAPAEIKAQVAARLMNA